MPIDAYAPCPGGTGKKIKFCCPDFIGELQKIDRMLEGDQHLACLQHIDTLLKDHPDRACLLATKTLLLRATNQLDDARATMATFIEKHPENMIAMADAAIMAAVDEGGRAALDWVHRALAGAEEGIQSRLYEAMGITTQALLRDGEWQAARALLQLQIAVNTEDQNAMSTLVELNRSPRIPLLIKDDSRLGTCPEDAPWKDRYNEALQWVQKGSWRRACEELLALAGYEPDAPAVWQSLATLRGWTADQKGAIEAWRKYASLDIPLEDAVEAEAMAMLMSEDPLKDQAELLSGRWEIKDFEQLQAAFSLDQRILQVPFDPAMMSSEGNPAPKAAYMLLDRPIEDKVEEITLDHVARFLGQTMIYGRQTDREARLEVIGMAAEDLPKLKDLLAEVAGESLAKDFEQEVMGKVSASYELLQRKWRPPENITQEQLRDLATEDQRDTLLRRWPEMKLGVLDGKSPREAAGDESCRIRLLAVIVVLENWSEEMPPPFDFNELRENLGLPTLGPIDPDELPTDKLVELLPLVRLSRVVVEKMSDEALLLSYRRAVAFSAVAPLKKLAQAVIDRPSMAGSEEQLRAYRQMAQVQEDPNEALKYVEQGREVSKTAGQSCAPWDLLELSLQLARGDGESAMGMIGHLQADHLREQGVQEALTQLLVQAGLIRPDGTPAGPPPAPGGSVVVSPDQPIPQQQQPQQQIWTPDGDEPGGEKKLWTPD